MKSLMDIVKDNAVGRIEPPPLAHPDPNTRARRLKVLVTLDPEPFDVPYTGRALVDRGTLTIQDGRGLDRTIYAPGQWVSVEYLD